LPSTVTWRSLISRCGVMR